MKEKNILVLSLEDNQAKQIANVVNNSSCKRILDFLVENDATETEISNKLEIPISTVHYNLQQLLKSKLIDWDKYHYSEKGKEVKHYTLANKYIIIAPKNKDKNNIIEQLQRIIPSIFVTIISAFVIYFNKKSVLYDVNLESESMAKATTYSADMAQETFVNTDISFWSSIVNNDIFWFLFGAFFVLFIYILIDIILKSKKE